jgi:FkbM family methyltransferase
MDKILHPLGLNIDRYFGDDLYLKHLKETIKKNNINIDLILDIGANTGQYAKKMIANGFEIPIISFEPLSNVYATLKKNSSRFPNWTVFDQCAIGDFDGEININISQNIHSSSILSVTKTHMDAAPSSKFSSKETVLIKKLDSVSDIINENNILLKIDTQGYEEKVLKGAKDIILKKTKIIQLELSLISLYEESLTFCDMVSMLKDLNFKPLFYSPGYTNRLNDDIQQLEGFFIREGAQ